ncbi:phosphoadenylyl-sulfate reductase [Pelomicrobium sp.]|jgi:phosphoadenosine phosphosulfate reductase|uniref:phosphoadenylyl-sulfate reductase n=1 Tax=Pelomicrobium sp. TaxID=2815319 RepID=UPI003FA7ADF9
MDQSTLSRRGAHSGLLAHKLPRLENMVREIARDFSPAALASSLGAEDMVLTDAVLRLGVEVEIFTLNTGKLHPETLALMDAVESRYRYRIRTFEPDPRTVQAFLEAHGEEGIYRSLTARKRCCEIRKLAPLRLALKGKRAWITGLRREQSVTRADIQEREIDAQHGLAKFNPLAHWSEEEVWDYLRAFDVPYNLLHDQGFRSIGCAPCTRPVAPGEDPRAGRWWWEAPASRECGLHVAPDGKLVRSKQVQP